MGNTTAVLDALGRRTGYTYDPSDNLETITDALSGLTKLDYDKADNLVAITDAKGHTNRFEYDADNMLVKFIEAGGQTTTYGYDAVHNQTAITNAKGNTWKYSYDALRRRISETDPLSHTTQYGYDPLGRLIRITDANIIKTRRDYDALGRLTAVVQDEQPGAPADVQTNVITRYEYDAVSNLTRITDANGEKTTFNYDLLDRLTDEVNPLKHKWHYEYDAVGNLTTRADANGDNTRYTYDADDLLTRISYPDSTSVGFGYDAVHNQTEMTDALGLTRNEYDDLNRLTASTNHLGQTVKYSYDPVGNRTGLTYPDGRAVKYEHDVTDFVERVIDPNGNIFNVTRDATHNITSVQNPNATTAQYGFDAAERLESVKNAWNSGEIISAFTYTLDKVGNRLQTEAQYGSGKPSQLTTDYGYDPLYRLTHSGDSEGHFADYTFDAVGNRLSLTSNYDPVSDQKTEALTTTYSYDAANELIAVMREVTPSDSTDRVGQTSQVLHAFVHEVEAQDGKHIESDTAASLLAQANALIAALESGTPPTPEEVAAELVALQDAVETAGAEGRIDNAGVVNSLLVKLRHARAANDRSGSSDVAVALYDYDRNGNRIRRTFRDKNAKGGQDWLRTEYTYDFENRLIQVQDFLTPGKGNQQPDDETQLTYDGFGRLFRRLHDQHSGGGGQKWVEYVYDGLDPIAEYEEPSPQYANYYRGLGRILSMQPIRGSGGGNQVFYYHDDGLGSVTALTKNQGASEHDYRYSDYGRILGNNGHAADASNFTDPHNHYTYTGQEWDEEIQLFHFYAREYEPETGVWLQQDPYRGRIDNPMTLNRYGYVGDNPINLSDFYGYDWITDLGNFLKPYDLISDAGNFICANGGFLLSPLCQVGEIKANEMVFRKPMTNAQRDMMLAQEQYADTARTKRMIQRAIEGRLQQNPKDCEVIRAFRAKLGHLDQQLQ